MIITCTSCSARYQLADTKIKATGTKVRCPKCSNKFVVFPDKFEGKDGTTELLGRLSSPRLETDANPKKSQTNIKERPSAVSRGDVAKKSTPDTFTEPNASLAATKPQVYDEESEVSFDQATRAYSDGESPGRRQSSKSAPPEDEMTPVFNRPYEASKMSARTPNPPPTAEVSIPLPPSTDEVSNSAPEASNSSEDDRQISDEAAQAFGSETLFEIQKADRKRGMPYWIKGLALGVIFLSGAFYSFEYVKKLIPQATKKSARIAIERPSGWYRDDPGVYQEEMVRQAGLPPSEKELPSNVALLAEALVLNGVLSSAQDQINQGLLFANKLQVDLPGSVASLYSFSAAAIAADQLMVMKSLQDRWELESRSDPEYRLLEFMTLAKAGSIEDAIKKSIDLLKETPEFQRANDYAYLLILQNGPISSRIIDRKFREQIANRYDGARNQRERNLERLPSLYLEIDRLLGRKPKTNGDQTPQRIEPQGAKEEDLKPILRPSVENTVQPPSIEEKPISKTSKTKAEKEKSKINPKRLPPPSDDLVETTKLNTQEKRDARKFYTQGNDLYKRGDVDGALAAYRQALKLDPEFADVYKRLGILYMEQKRNDRAVRSFKIFLQLRPGSQDKKEVEGWISKIQ